MSAPSLRLQFLPCSVPVPRTRQTEFWREPTGKGNGERKRFAGVVWRTDALSLAPGVPRSLVGYVLENSNESISEAAKDYGEPAGARDEPLPVTAQGQPRGLASVGRG